MRTAGGLRVVIVDDHAVYRRGMRWLLEDQGLEVIGEAADGRAGVELVAELRPDVTLMDMGMPIMSGPEAIAEIVAANPSARVLVVSGREDDDSVRDALLAGACGYLLKLSPTAAIIDGIRAAAEGASAISPRVAAGLVVRLRERAQTEPDAVRMPPPDLTNRELDVLRLVAAGKENSAIASELFLSPKTVKNHVAAILDKLAIDNRVQAAVFAIRHGIAG
ncbi:MAG: response regulator [Solirubrobacteraceae bacterium]